MQHHDTSQNIAVALSTVKLKIVILRDMMIVVMLIAMGLSVAALKHNFYHVENCLQVLQNFFGVFADVVRQGEL